MLNMMAFQIVSKSLIFKYDIIRIEICSEKKLTSKLPVLN